jgi:hypothetical protein
LLLLPQVEQTFNGRLFLAVVRQFLLLLKLSPPLLL